MGNDDWEKAKLRVRKMKLWTKAFIIACLLEILSMLVLRGKDLVDMHGSLLLMILWWYHLPAGLFGFTVISIVAHLSGLSHGTALNTIFYFTEFAFQIVFTTPIVFLILRSIRRSRGTRNQGP